MQITDGHEHEALMEYITTVLNGRITEDAYGTPQGRLTVISD